MTYADTSTPALILRMDHYSALGIMRSLGRLGVSVYGVDASPNAPALRSRYCRGGHVWDLDEQPAAASLEFLAGLAKVIRPRGGRPMLLPTNDETALFISRNASSLSESYLFAVNPPELTRSLYDKKEMYFLARRLDIPTADTAFPQSRKDVVEFTRQARFPVMLKASDNIVVARRSGKRMVIARSKDELLSSYDAMEDPRNPSLMLQEYIPGGDDTVWMFNGYFDENSECLFGMTGRKIHQTPVYTGMTCLGVCLANDFVERTTKRLMKAIGYRGILDIGYRYDARDGSYRLLDVNPRLGATFRLFVGTDGMDVVRAQYFHLTGQRVPPARMAEGRKWVVEDLDLISCLRYYRDGVLGPGEWPACYRGVREGAWFASDDPAPFVRMCGRLCARPFRRVARTLAPPRSTTPVSQQS